MSVPLFTRMRSAADRRIFCSGKAAPYKWNIKCRLEGNGRVGDRVDITGRAKRATCLITLNLYRVRALILSLYYSIKLPSKSSLTSREIMDASSLVGSWWRSTFNCRESTTALHRPSPPLTVTADRRNRCNVSPDSFLWRGVNGLRHPDRPRERPYARRISGRR